MLVSRGLGRRADGGDVVERDVHIWEVDVDGEVFNEGIV